MGRQRSEGGIETWKEQDCPKSQDQSLAELLINQAGTTEENAGIFSALHNTSQMPYRYKNLCLK